MIFFPKKQLPRATALLLLLALVVPATAAPLPQKKTVLKVNPATLQKRIASSNFQVLKGLSKLHIAKDKVSIARANLLPSLNLGISSFATGGSGFAVSAISFLFPFLLPSNWANLRQSKMLLEAEKISYHVMGLNQYASAYSVYATVVNDLALRAILVQQYEDLVKIRAWLEKQKDLGIVPQQDVDAADAQARLAFSSLSQMDALLIRERAAMRELLALGINDEMVFEPMHVPESPMESMDLMTAVKKIQAVAPENLQMQYLVSASRSGKWSRAFSFMGGSNLNVSRDASGDKWNQYSLGTGLNIGFSTVPNIKLSNDQIVELQLQARELLQQQIHLAESTLGSLNESKKQLASNRIAVEKLKSVFETELQKYMLGLTDILHVLDAKIKVAQGSATYVRSQLDVDTLRITLHRALLADNFKSVPKCAISQAALDHDRRGWFGRLFRSKAGGLSIDEVCLPAR